MTIETLRAELAQLDRELVRLVARRQAVARAVGQLKDRHGLALRDFAQEREVLERARRLATEEEVSPQLVEELMSLVIRSSLAVQEHQRVAARAGGTGRRALVIGGSGRMGGWFVRFLLSQGFAVEVADPAPPPPGTEVPHRAEWRDGPLDHDLVVVAAPLRETAGILTNLAPRRPTGVVFDIGSLKSPLRDSFRALLAAGVRVTSIHPMFGPDTDMLSGRHVILVDLGVADANREAGALFASTMAEVVPMDLESHDRTVAFILGLSHALNIAFFTALAMSGQAAGHLAHLSSTTFDQQLAVASRVAAENPHLYFEIQHLNDYGQESLHTLRDAVQRVYDLVQSGDEPGFVALMEQGRRYLEGRRRD
jgi:chorismate mutase/prephenate dehydrogenase